MYFKKLKIPRFRDCSENSQCTVDPFLLWGQGRRLRALRLLTGCSSHILSSATPRPSRAAAPSSHGEFNYWELLTARQLQSPGERGKNILVMHTNQPWNAGRSIINPWVQNLFIPEIILWNYAPPPASRILRCLDMSHTKFHSTLSFRFFLSFFFFGCKNLLITWSLLHGEAFVVDDPTYGRGGKKGSQKIKKKKKKRRKNVHLLWSLGFLAWWETRGGGGGKIKKKKRKAVLS